MRRIQMRRDRPWRCDALGAVIVDRTTKWGNPFRVGDEHPDGSGQPMTAEDACECFEFLTLPTLPVQELAGKDLACWCSLDAPCHADVLLKYAARLKPDQTSGKGA